MRLLTNRFTFVAIFYCIQRRRVEEVDTVVVNMVVLDMLVVDVVVAMVAAVSITMFNSKMVPRLRVSEIME